MQVVGITGGTGFVGGHLSKQLQERGHKVVIFTTRPAPKQPGNVAYAHWDAAKNEIDTSALGRIDAMVNLAGAGIADKRWTASRKKEIVESRVNATNFLVAQMQAHAPRCRTFISTSAIGYYGPDKGQAAFTEDDPPQNDFLADTCHRWEIAAENASAFARTVILRFGVVLGKESGAFPKFVKPMSMGMVPLLGGGRQIMSWIEANDLARLIAYAVEHEGMQGVYNAVAPQVVTQRRLMRTIASIKGGVKIPLRVPAWALQLMLGEMSTELLKSCTVSAAKTLATGFHFKHPDIADAAKAILRGNSKS